MRKNVEALGRFSARIVAIDDGSFAMSGSDLTRPAESVTMRKPCWSVLSCQYGQEGGAQE